MKILNPSARRPILGDVTEFHCRVIAGSWAWAEKNAEAVAAHWAEVRAAKPGMFDGRVLIATEVGIEGAHMVSTHIEVAYSALYHWQSLGFPRADAFNLFGAGVVVTADGAVLLGRMAAHTANAGLVYFPCGTPDLDDVQDGLLDVEASTLRELEEETGLGAAHLTASGQKWISWDGALFCCAVRYDTQLTAGEVEALVHTHLSAQDTPELDRVLLVRSPGDIDGLDVPAYAAVLIEDVLG